MLHNFFIGYLVLGVILFLVNESDVDVDQFSDILFKIPMLTIIPYCLIFSCYFLRNRSNRNIATVREIIATSFTYAMVTVFWAYFLNNSFAVSKDHIIRGIIVDKKQGRGKSKPSITILDNVELIKLRVTKNEWQQVKINQLFYINLDKGLLGFYYKDRLVTSHDYSRK